MHVDDSRVTRGNLTGGVTNGPPRNLTGLGPKVGTPEPLVQKPHRLVLPPMAAEINLARHDWPPPPPVHRRRQTSWFSRTYTPRATRCLSRPASTFRVLPLAPSRLGRSRRATAGSSHLQKEASPKGTSRSNQLKCLVCYSGHWPATPARCVCSAPSGSTRPPPRPKRSPP